VTRALTFGCFDLLHHGHMRLLARLAEQADHLTVALVTDACMQAIGKRAPVNTFEIRAEMLLALRSVDAVVPHEGVIDGTGHVKLIGEKIRQVRALAIDVVGLGGDHEGTHDFLLPYCRVVYFPRTPGVSTSALRARMV
jgi:glycerol-3-phosphate cytidylyltransferase